MRRKMNWRQMDVGVQKSVHRAFQYSVVFVIAWNTNVRLFVTPYQDISVPEIPDVPDVEVSAADQILELEALQSEINVLMGQVRALKARGKLKYLQLICVPCTKQKAARFLGRPWRGLSNGRRSQRRKAARSGESDATSACSLLCRGIWVMFMSFYHFDTHHHRHHKLPFNFTLTLAWRLRWRSWWGRWTPSRQKIPLLHQRIVAWVSNKEARWKRDFSPQIWELWISKVLDSFG